MTWLKNIVMKLLSHERSVISKSPFTGKEQKIIWPGQREWNVVGHLFIGHPLPSILLFLSLLVSVVVAAFGHGEWFSRMGAVTVAATIYFSATAVRSIRSFYDAQVYAEIFKGADEIARSVSERVSMNVQVHAITQQTRLGVASEIVANASQKMRPFYLIEIIFGIVGTAQWAFGSFAVKIFSDQSAAAGVAH